jgi:hypothetical protein
VRAVSVVSATGVQAEVAATALAVGGPDASFDRSIFRQAVVILDDGTQMTVPGSMEGRVNVEAHTLRAALAV